MKTKILILLGIILAFGINPAYSQGFQPPAKGKAVVYFVRATSYGFAINFQYFDNDKFIGEFKGENYMRYECDPGHHLLWSVSENKEFMEADLTEGGTYIVKIDVIMGGFKAHVGFTPISYSDKKRFDLCRGLVMSEPPVPQNEEDLAEMNAKLAQKINKYLTDYHSKDDSQKKFRVLSADMAIPPEELK